MADLFTRAELASYMQVAEVDNATADLLLALVTSEIRQHVGAATYDALADQTIFKGVALEVAKRAYLNPSGIRSMTIGGYSETLASETFGGVTLTDAEQARIDALLGRSGGAFTIRPAGEPDCPPWVSSRRRLVVYGQDFW